VTLPEESRGSSDEDKAEKAAAGAPTQQFEVDELNDATESTVEPEVNEEPAPEPEPVGEVTANEPTEVVEAHETPETSAVPEADDTTESADDILDRAFGALRDGVVPTPTADETAVDLSAADVTSVDALPVDATRVDRIQPTWNPAPAPTPRAGREPAGAMTGAWARVPAQLKGGQGGSKWKIATAVGVAAVVVIAVIVVVVGGSSHNNSTAASSAANTSKATNTKTTKPKPKVVEVASFESMSPSDGATGVNGAGTITVTYSHKLPADANLPTLSPSIPGSWKVEGNQAIFTPSVGYTAGTHVTVHIPATTVGATTTTAATTTGFTTGQYSTLRLEQLLAQLGYLPVSWAPSDGSSVPASDANAQLSAAYNAPSGNFTFDSGYPSSLTDQWSVGSDNEVLSGAIWTFEYDQNITMDGQAGPTVWEHLLDAVARNQTDHHGYSYVYVNQGNGGNEYLDLYYDGKLKFQTPVNTGIAGRGTADGTYPVYERFQVTQMQGTNPDGTKYNDTVYWVSYFNGGDAVHYFVRASYGFYQSLGCVETPQPYAEDAYNLMTYGTLVTVTGQES
jgi:hypothetical protein